jgi:polysaccharide export outer membrane protein
MIALGCIFTLSACTVVPGSNMSTRGKPKSGVSAAGYDQNMVVTPITPALLKKLHRPKPNARNNPDLGRQMASYDYRIGPGDVINITIWDHPELTIPAGSYRAPEDSGNWVHADGTIFYPYIGKVRVAGKTVSEVRSIVAQRLSEYIERPQVDVSISAFRSQKVYVTGEVLKSGTQPITNVPMTLLDAINQSGGITEFADWHHVTLTRKGQTYAISLHHLMQEGDLTRNVLLGHGDIIHVPRNDEQKVFVMGEVEQPGVVRMDRDRLSLTEALAQVNGLKQSKADAAGVYVIRANAQSSAKPGQVADIYRLNMKDASAMVLGDRFTLQPRDIVYVSSAPIATWNRLINQLIPTALLGVSGTTIATDIDNL